MDEIRDQDQLKDNAPLGLGHGEKGRRWKSGATEA